MNVNGTDLYCETQGAGEALLLLAGFGCDHSFWAPVAPLLAGKYKVICPDNRGSGQSASPVGAYTAGQMADDTAGLLDHLGVETAHVAGHSLGPNLTG